jgi:uncharacterized DUF497 family protein
VKKIAWNLEKNEWLKENRGVCFEQVAEILEKNEEVDVIDHPNQRKYPGQEMYIVNLNDYIYLIPAIETDAEIFLKTIIPSRKMTAKYLR